jgi:hypothetical protein
MPDVTPNLGLVLSRYEDQEHLEYNANWETLDSTPGQTGYTGYTGPHTGYTGYTGDTGPDFTDFTGYTGPMTLVGYGQTSVLGSPYWVPLYN